MVKVSKIKKIILAFTLIFAAGCANQLPPGGGEDDSIPPQIIYVYPPDGTTNYDENYFELEFSEYVDKRTFKDAIFISPAIDGDLEISWTNKTVTAEFPNQLKEDITYTITIGTDVVDYNNKNRLAKTFNFSFSTGDEIDERIITGKVYDPKPEGIMIFAYRFMGETDSLIKQKPDYISQTGSEGNYTLGGLAEGNYRIFAVDDKFRDLIFQAEQDRIGIPYQDIELKESDSLFVGLNFFISEIDTIPPEIVTAVMTDKNHILVTLSEEYPNDSLSSNNFVLIDSTTNESYPLKHFYSVKNKNKELVLITDRELQGENDIYLVGKNIPDKNNNLKTEGSVYLTINNSVDTTSVYSTLTEPSSGSRIINQSPSIKIFFNDAFPDFQFNEAIKLIDTVNNEVNLRIEKIDDAGLTVNIDSLLPTSEVYILSVDLSKFEDAAGNSIDSVMRYTFKTISGLEYTGVSGKIVNAENLDNIKLILQSVKNEDKKYKLSPQETGSFEFSEIDAGEYMLWAYEDRNENSEYDFGSVIPFEFAERFYVYPNTLNLRARWTQTDVVFDFALKAFSSL